MLAREPMSHVDAAWLHMDRPENTADIVALLQFGGGIDFPRVRRLVQERFLRHPKFLQRIVEDGFAAAPSWEGDPKFTIGRHLLRRRLRPGDAAALPRLVGEVATEPLERDRPPWRLYHVEGDAGGAALIVKLHHCMGDGFALVSLLLDLADEADAARSAGRGGGATPGATGGVGGAFRPPDGNEAPQRRAPSFQDLLLVRAPEAIAAAIREPARAADLAREGIAFGRSLARMALLPTDPVTTLSSVLSGFRRAAWSSPLPLERVRAAAHRAGATVNDLLLSALAGALRVQLAASGERVDGMTLRALVPVNLRDASAEPDAPAGNQFGLVFLDLPVGVASRAGRLAAVRAAVDVVKRSPDALVAYTVLAGLGLVSPELERLGTQFFARKASLVVTNVPGPRHALHLLGRRLDRILFWVPHPATLGLGVSLISYAGAVSVGVRADAAVLPEPGSLVAGVEAELAALEGADLGRRIAGGCVQ